MDTFDVCQAAKAEGSKPSMIYVMTLTNPAHSPYILNDILVIPIPKSILKCERSKFMKCF